VIHSLSNAAAYLRKGKVIVTALREEVEKGKKADPQMVSENCARFTQWLNENNEIAVTGIKQSVIKEADYLHSVWARSSGQGHPDSAAFNRKKPSKKAITIATALTHSIPLIKKESLHDYITYPTDVMCNAVKGFIAFGDAHLAANCTQSHMHYYDTFAKLGAHNQQEALIGLASSIEMLIDEHNKIEKQMKLGVAITGYLHCLNQYESRVLDEHTLSPETKSFFSDMLPYVEMLADNRIPNTTPRLRSGVNAMMVGLNKWGESILSNERVIACEKDTDYLVDIYRCGSLSITHNLERERDAYDLLVSSKGPLGLTEKKDIRYLIAYAIKTNDPNFSISDLRLNRDNYLVIYSIAMDLATYRVDDAESRINEGVNTERLAELIISAHSFGVLEKGRILAVTELRPYLTSSHYFKRDILASDLGM
jgi:hypothetical protein